MQTQSSKRALPRKRVPRLATHQDNPAAILWREHKESTDTVTLNADLVIVDDTYETIAQDNGTYITFQDQTAQKDIGSTVKFGIWGDRLSVIETKKAIENWARSNSKRTGDRGFSKLASLLPSERSQKEKEFKVKVRQCRYRQYPPTDLGFQTIGSFHWPVEEYRPDEVFGQNFEALDPIRMECSCYISFVPERAMFQVFGNTKDVEKALVRIRKTYFQVVARSLADIRIRAYLLYWPTPLELPSQVRLVSYENTAVMSPDGRKLPASSSKSPRSQESIHRSATLGGTSHRTQQSFDQIERATEQVLGKLHHCRGDIELVVHLGTFLLDRFQTADGDNYSLVDFESMMSLPQFVGSVTDEVGDRGVEKSILSTFNGLNNILEPADPLVKKLTDIEPTYSSIFTISETAGDILMAVKWCPVKNMYGKIQYELGETKWTRLDRETGKHDILHDMSLINLDNGSAWKVKIIVSENVDTQKVSNLLREFATRIKLVFPKNNHGHRGEPTIELPSFLRPKSYRQQKGYQFGIRDTDYTLNLVHFQDHVLSASTSSSRKVHMARFEPRWSLGVSRTYWGNQLSENARLAIGGGAGWKADMDQWFPKITDSDQASGFQQLVKKLGELSTIVYQKGEDRDKHSDMIEIFQGMQVG